MKKRVSLKIQFTDTNLNIYEFCKLCALGMAFSLGLLYIGISVLVAAVSLFSGDLMGVLAAVMLIVFAPIICAISGGFFGVIIYLGLKILRKFNRSKEKVVHS
jgi:hypothetical protein